MTDESWGGNPNPLKVMDLTLRDGTQSLFATRMRTEDMIPMAERMDEAGFWAEVWGGATFDSMSRFLGEDPWERPRTLRKYARRPPFPCCSGARTWWATATTPTTWPGSSWI
jgi:pyruvate carboxylase subunit B